MQIWLTERIDLNQEKSDFGELIVKDCVYARFGFWL